MAMALLIMREKLNLHLGHVHTRGAFASAALAADAQIHGRVHRRARKRIGTELSGQRQTQCVRASSRDVLLVACYTKARAHSVRIKLATMPIVVAHLDGFREAARVIPARA